MNQKKFKKLINILSTFPNQKKDFTDLKEVREIAKDNRVWSVVKYVCGIQNVCLDTINSHYERVLNCSNVFNKLDKNGIPYAVIKGAYLDKIAYGNLGLRDSKDLDILIEKQNNKTIKKF